jgi:hypothetical protein
MDYCVIVYFMNVQSMTSAVNYPIPILPTTDATAPELSITSKHVNDSWTAGDLPGTAQTSSPVVIHLPRPTSGGWRIYLDSTQHSIDSMR